MSAGATKNSEDPRILTVIFTRGLFSSFGLAGQLLLQPVLTGDETLNDVGYHIVAGGVQQDGSHYSILLQLQVTRDNLTGETKITGCDYVPIYTLTPERDGEPMRVVRIEEAIRQYESSHIHRVNATAYQNMKKALERIRSRVGF